MKLQPKCIRMDDKVFDLFGLTSPRVAHQPLMKRGRPGHEKYGSLEDAFAEGSMLSTVNLWRRARYRDKDFYTQFKINSSKFYLLRYDPDIYAGLHKLRAQGVKVQIVTSPRIAMVRIMTEIKRGPNRRLVKFLRTFYADIMSNNQRLSSTVERLARVKRSRKKKRHKTIRKKIQPNTRGSAEIKLTP